MIEHQKRIEILEYLNREVSPLYGNVVFTTDLLGCVSIENYEFIYALVFAKSNEEIVEFFRSAMLNGSSNSKWMTNIVNKLADALNNDKSKIPEFVNRMLYTLFVFSVLDYESTNEEVKNFLEESRPYAEPMNNKLTDLFECKSLKPINSVDIVESISSNSKAKMILDEFMLKLRENNYAHSEELISQYTQKLMDISDFDVSEVLSKLQNILREDSKSFCF